MAYPITSDLTRLLPSHLYDIPRWRQLFEAMSEVFYQLIDQQREALAAARTPENLARIYKAMALKMLGLEYDTGRMTDEEMDRVANFLGLYYVRFMGFMRSTRFNLNTLWSSTPAGRTTYGQLTIGPNGLPVDQGGPAFPTSHVGVGYDADWEGFNEADVRALFNALAPIHIVLAFLARTHTAQAGTIYFGIGAAQWAIHPAIAKMPDPSAEIYFGAGAIDWACIPTTAEEPVEGVYHSGMSSTASINGSSSAQFGRSIVAGLAPEQSEFAFDRGTEASYIDATGKLVWLPANQLRVDHHVDGVSSPARVLLEPYRINRVPNPTDVGGVDWEATVDLDRTVNSTGGWDGGPIVLLSKTGMQVEDVLDMFGAQVRDLAGNVVQILVSTPTLDYTGRTIYLPAGNHVLSWVSNTFLGDDSRHGFTLKLQAGAVVLPELNLMTISGENPSPGTVTGGMVINSVGSKTFGNFERKWASITVPISGPYRFTLYPAWGNGTVPMEGYSGVWALWHVQIEQGESLPTTPIRGSLATPIGVREADHLVLGPNNLGPDLTVLVKYDLLPDSTADDTRPIYAANAGAVERIDVSQGPTQTTLTVRAGGHTNVQVYNNQPSGDDKLLLSWDTDYRAWHNTTPLGTQLMAYPEAPQWTSFEVAARPTLAAQATMLLDQLHVISGGTVPATAVALTT